MTGTGYPTTDEDWLRGDVHVDTNIRTVQYTYKLIRSWF